MSLLLLGTEALAAAPTFTNLTAGGTTTDATGYTTASVTPTGDRLILVAVNAYTPAAPGSIQPPVPTVTGNGITYDLVLAQDIDTAGTDRSRLFVFRGMTASPAAGAISIDFGAVLIGSCTWSVDQSSADVDTSGANGSGAIAASAGSTSAVAVTTQPTTFSPAMTSGNAGYVASGNQSAEAQTPRAGWTELGDFFVTVNGIETQYIAGTDTAGSSSWATASRAASVVVEIRAASTSASLTVQDAAQAQTADSLALTQLHQLATQPATQAQTSDNAALTLAVSLAVQGATQAQTAGSAALTQAHILAVAAAGQVQTSASVALGVAVMTDITITIGPTRLRELATVGPTRPSTTVGPTRTGVAAALTRLRELLTMGPTRGGAHAGATRPGITAGPTRTGTTAGPTRRDRG